MVDLQGANDIIPRSTLADEVAKKLEALITTGQYAVGERLPSETELARQLDVGRSSMREAVRTLQAAGYLRSTQGRGVFVVSDRAQTIRPIDQSLVGGYTMNDLVEARVAIESKAAELAAERRSADDGPVLDDILARAAAAGVTHPEFVRLDGRFHRHIAQASGNPLLLHMWESIAPLFEEYSLKVIGLPGRKDRAHADHRAIADAVIAGEASKAAELAADHVMTVRHELEEDAQAAIR